MPNSAIPPRDASLEVARSFELADRWSRSTDFQRAFDRALANPKDREYAMADPKGFLIDAGVPLPDGLDITFMEQPPRAMPGPDFEQYSIRLFNCRTYWVQDKSAPDKPRQWITVQVCFGFEIVRNPFPRGPAD